MEEIKQETGLVLDYKEMPAYKGAKEKQQLLVQNYPFVTIIDNPSYETAKQSRTALRQGRYDLQNGEKAIVTKLSDFRQFIKEETLKLIDITIEAENKQQAEIERYEAEKKREKEEALLKEKQRKEALRAQIFGFRDSKTSAIETSTTKTIAAIISDIETAQLQVDEFEEDFKQLKEKLVADAKKKEAQLLEDERLKAERKKAEEERKKLEEEKQKLEAQRKAQEEALRKQKEAEEAKLKIEREKLEAQKAEIARVEAERKAREDAELKAKKQEEIDGRIEKVKALGFQFHPQNNEFSFGSLICEKWEIEQVDETTFIEKTLPGFNRLIEEEKQRIELAKPDKEKLTEMLNYFDLSEFNFQLNTEKANVLMYDFVSKFNALVAEYKELVNNQL